METNLFVFIINHNTITGCKTMTSIVLQISKIHYKLSEVCSLNYASPEPEPVLTHLISHGDKDGTFLRQPVHGKVRRRPTSLDIGQTTHVVEVH